MSARTGTYVYNYQVYLKSSIAPEENRLKGYGLGARRVVLKSVRRKNIFLEVTSTARVKKLFAASCCDSRENEFAKKHHNSSSSSSLHNRAKAKIRYTLPLRAKIRYTLKPSKKRTRRARCFSGVFYHER